MSIKRKQGWERALREWINHAQSQKFVWGEWDCCLAMADAVLAQTGTDIADGWRGAASDARSAVRVVIERTGRRTFEEAIASILAGAGLVECRPLEAHRGDVVMGDSPDGPTWGVVDLSGARIVFASNRGSLRWVPLHAARRAWHVPF